MCSLFLVSHTWKALSQKAAITLDLRGVMSAPCFCAEMVKRYNQPKQSVWRGPFSAGVFSRNAVLGCHTSVTFKVWAEHCHWHHSVDLWRSYLCHTTDFSCHISVPQRQFRSRKANRCRQCMMAKYFLFLEMYYPKIRSCSFSRRKSFHSYYCG